MRRFSFKSLTNIAVAVLVLQCIPAVVLAATDESVTTAGLLAQVSDPAVAAASTESAPAVDSAAAVAAGGFSTEQLEQLVAPIALYPDALLMQILMASTYPLEIVEADRWISKQPDLTGDALNEALKERDWDPSVKSLTTLSSVLKQMSENLDWTQDLGDAFLAQQNDLMDTVQRMRGLAYDAGNLATTEQQTVQQQEDKIIIIESTSPEVIYVPTYSPTVVYGPAWGYPSYYYPAYYYPPMPGYGLVAFGVGVAVGAAIWGNAGWGWGNNNVNIDIDRNTEFNRNTDNNFNGDREGGRGESGRGEGGRGEGGKSQWQHDSSHRKGVNYGSSDVAQKFGGNSGSNRVTQDQARGRSSATASNRGSTGTQARDRSAASPRTNSSPSASNRSQSSANSARSSGSSARSSSNSAFSGSRSPSTDRMSSSRGASSRGSQSYGGSRGGASRGGGGRRR